MQKPPASRRAFFGQMASGCGFGVALSQAPPPEKAWIIVALGWEHNDEWAFEEGEFPQPQVYYDKTLADAACQRQVEDFFDLETPAEFDIDWAYYFPDGVDDEQAVTWEQVRAAGFPEPFYVMELTAAAAPPTGASAHE